MTILVNRPISGSKTHALVIGVGCYPDAKPNRGVDSRLRDVPDLDSAADSAKLVCDWLLEYQDQLSAPLSSLEALISDTDTDQNRYRWEYGPVDAATEANVMQKGYEWYQRVVAEEGNIAFLYCCGHGASHLNHPILFLEDLNKDVRAVWKFVDLQLLAISLQKNKKVAAAFLFSDACGEFVTEFELSKAQDTRFYAAPNPITPSRNQVSLLCAAAEGQLAYEGRQPGGDVMLGRFTQALIAGLRGLSARSVRRAFSVHSRDLLSDLKHLRRAYFDHWDDDLPFEPYQAITATDSLPIVRPTSFLLPVIVMVDPVERTSEFGLLISRNNSPNDPHLQERGRGDPRPWRVEIPPGHDAHYAIAVSTIGKHHWSLFQPIGPIFEQWVLVE